MFPGRTETTLRVIGRIKAHLVGHVRKPSCPGSNTHMASTIRWQGALSAKTHSPCMCSMISAETMVNARLVVTFFPPNYLRFPPMEHIYSGSIAFCTGITLLHMHLCQCLNTVRMALLMVVASDHLLSVSAQYLARCCDSNISLLSPAFISCLMLIPPISFQVQSGRHEISHHVWGQLNLCARYTWPSKLQLYWRPFGF